MFLEDIFILLLVFFVLRFVFRIVIPVFRSVRMFRDGAGPGGQSAYGARPGGQSAYGAGPAGGTASQSRRDPSITIVNPDAARQAAPKSKADDSDYIDFEEIK